MVLVIRPSCLPGRSRRLALTCSLVIGAALLSCSPKTGPQFSSPPAIGNRYLPLGALVIDSLTGRQVGDSVIVCRTADVSTRGFVVNGQTVTSLILTDQSFDASELERVAIGYYVQSDDSTVYCLGKNIDRYENGQIVDNEESWLLGVDVQQPGIVMPAQPRVGDTFTAQNVPLGKTVRGEVVSDRERVTVPAGTFEDCLKVKLTSSVDTEYRYYAPGVGIVKEVTPDGGVELVTHH
jgi:hypothetical protein